VEPRNSKHGTGVRIAPLYRRLPRGPNGMRREQIALNQRARLYGGIIESVARRGYESTTVADVIGLAGVSRRAFYEHFDDKDDCLLAAHNSVVGHARLRAIDGWRSQHGWANRLHAACKSLFDDVIEHPKGARLVLVDSLGITPRARERMKLASLVFERLLHVALRADANDGDLPYLPPQAIVGGVRHVIFARARERREPELHTLADEVLDWIEAYRSPRESRLAFPARSISAPLQQSAAFLIEDDPRARILDATARLTLKSGYANLTDSQLAKSARLPTQALHKQFPSKEACFLAVIEAFNNETCKSAHAQMLDACSWPAEVHCAIEAYLDYLATHQRLMRLAFVDVFDVGPAMIGQMASTVEGLTTLLTGAGPAPHRGPLVSSEAITGAIWATIFSHAISDSASQLPALADRLTFIVLAPYIGARAAAEEILAVRRSSAMSKRRPLSAQAPEGAIMPLYLTTAPYATTGSSSISRGA
jgi:AcrR family transcriptional regulator